MRDDRFSLPLSFQDLRGPPFILIQQVPTVVVEDRFTRLGV
jgi:hypothetical protein